MTHKAKKSKSSSLLTFIFVGLLIASLQSMSNREAYGLETSDENLSDTKSDYSGETFIQGVVESLGVFKNGIVVVRERYQIPGSGRYSIMAPPSPIHGTFFIQSEAMVEATTSSAECAIPVADEKIDWATDFQGRWLSVVLPGETEARNVRVIQVEGSSPDAVETQSDVRLSFYSSLTSPRELRLPSDSKSVLLETENGETIWLANSSLISSAVVKGGAPTTVLRKRPRIILDVKSADSNKSVNLYLTYLTRQVSWAPQYRIVLKDEENLEIEQSAIIINDWRDFSEASTCLYSGFPQITLQNSISPMAPGVDLSAFLSSLNVRNGRQTANSAFATQMVMNNAPPSYSAPRNSLPELENEDPGEGGVDIFAQDVGVRSLKKGERTLLTVDRKQTPYRRFIRWDVINTRDINGRIGNPATNLDSNTYGMTVSGTNLQNSSFTEPWDILAFRNPFPFPFTTGPASVFTPDRFLAQNSLFWCNPGEETILPITKSLGLRVNSTEVEHDFIKEPNQNMAPGGIQKLDVQHPVFRSVRKDLWGQTIQLRGAYFRVSVIDSTIELKNLRNEETEVEICRQFRGIEILDSFEGFEESPEIVRLNESITTDYRASFNPLSETSWTITLKPMEEKVLKFSYQVLIAQ